MNEIIPGVGVFNDFLDGIVNQLVGFFLWVVVFPLRLVIGVLDPIFTPVTALIDFESFLDAIEVLRPFFRDVNYFIPFAAALGIFASTALFAFLFVLLVWAIQLNVHGFGAFAESVMLHIVFDAVDKVRKFFRVIADYLIGNFFE